LLRELGGSILRPIIIIGEISYITESFARVFSDELLCSVHLFNNIDDWRRSPYTQCAAFIVVDAPARLDLSNCHDVVWQIKSLGDDSPIIVISDVVSAMRVAMNFSRGARGYISTGATLDETLAAIRLVLSGGVFVPANIALPGHRPGESNL
jgi:DNA-binding NarL/FixJ family response regulator